MVYTKVQVHWPFGSEEEFKMVDGYIVDRLTLYSIGYFLIMTLFSIFRHLIKSRKIEVKF